MHGCAGIKRSSRVVGSIFRRGLKGKKKKKKKRKFETNFESLERFLRRESRSVLNLADNRLPSSLRALGCLSVQSVSWTMQMFDSVIFGRYHRSFSLIIRFATDVSRNGRGMVRHAFRI